MECIKDEFRLRNVDNPQKIHMQLVLSALRKFSNFSFFPFCFREVLDFIEWGPDSTKLFSKTGCKRISSKVAVLVAKYYSHIKPKNEL